MQGPSEFTITGTLGKYDATSFLPQIKVPTLFTVGQFDEVGPELVRRFAARVPAARYVQLAGSAHMTPWDARDENVKSCARSYAWRTRPARGREVGMIKGVHRSRAGRRCAGGVGPAT